MTLRPPITVVAALRFNFDRPSAAGIGRLCRMSKSTLADLRYNLQAVALVPEPASILYSPAGNQVSVWQRRAGRCGGARWVRPGELSSSV